MSLILTAPMPNTTSEMEEGTYTLQFTGYDYPITEGCGYGDDQNPETCKMERRTKFHFAVLDDDSGKPTGESLSEFVTLQSRKPGESSWYTQLGEKAKLAGFLKALNGGIAITPGESIDIDAFKGKKLMATIVLNAKGYPKVTAPVAIKKKKTVAAPVNAAADDPFADEE